MTDTHSSGRRWVWPALSPLSLAALLLGSWWLAGARPEPAGAGTQPGASRPRLSSQPPTHPHPHPAALDGRNEPRRDWSSYRTAAASGDF